MKTVGEILKQTRLQKKITLEEIEKATRIRKKFLIAFEENQLDKLPTFTFSRGFLKNYSEFLGLNENDLIAIFRRQLKLEESGIVGPGEGAKPRDVLMRNADEYFAQKSQAQTAEKTQ